MVEKTDLGKGRFLITHTPEEIRELNRFIEISHHSALTALAVSRREAATDPAEIQELTSEIKSHIEAVDRLMSAPDINVYKTSDDPISEVDRQIGGAKHAFINGEVSFEKAATRINLILEQNSPGDPTPTA